MSQDSPIRVRSNSLSPSSCMSFCPSPTNDSEPVSDQIDRLNIIITGMMKDLVNIDAELSDPEEITYLSDYSPRAIGTQNPFHYVSPLISERDEISVNCSSRALSLNLSVEERQLENEIELRLETEFLIYCRMSMCLEDYRSHELRYMSKSCYDTDLSDIEIRRDSCDSPVSFRAYDDSDHTVSYLASLLSGRFGVPFKNRTANDLVNSIESLFIRDVELTIKQISDLESMFQVIIDTSEKGEAVRRELHLGQFHINLHVLEPKGDISIPQKHRLARNLTQLASEKYRNFTEEKNKLEEYIKQLENEILKLRSEVTTRPHIEDFSSELSKSMHIAFEEEYRPSDDFRSFDLNRTSTSSLATLEDIKSHSNLDIEFKTLKTKRDEIEKLKNNIEWQLHDLVFLKKECEKREFEVREKELRLDMESQNLLYKERELYNLQENLTQQKKDYEQLIHQVSYEKVELDKEKLEFETDKQLFEHSQKVKSIEAMNLKENISKLLVKKEEMRDSMNSASDILHKQENRPSTARPSTARQSTARPSTTRLSTSPVPFKLSSEISLEELEMLKHEIEHKLENLAISDSDRNRLGVQLSRIETQIASFKVKRVLEESNSQVRSVSRISGKLNKTWVEEDRKVLRKSNYQASMTPQPSKGYRLDNDSNYKENSIHRKLPSECEIGHFYNEPSFEKEKDYVKPKETPKKLLMNAIKPLDLSKVFAIESVNFKKSVNEEQLIEREEKLKVKENELIERMIKIRCKEIEQKEIDRLLDKDRSYMSDARLDLLSREKDWHSAWMKIPDANELIPLVQKGHLTLMKELDNIYKLKKMFDKEKIEISKHWRQVTEGKRLIELQKKELEQSQKDLANEKRSLCKMKENFTTILPAIQSMISV